MVKRRSDHRAAAGHARVGHGAEWLPRESGYGAEWVFGEDVSAADAGIAQGE